jgi:hypothetical protein
MRPIHGRREPAGILEPAEVMAPASLNHPSDASTMGNNRTIPVSPRSRPHPIRLTGRCPPAAAVGTNSRCSFAWKERPAQPGRRQARAAGREGRPAGIAGTRLRGGRASVTARARGRGSAAAASASKQQSSTRVRSSRLVAPTRAKRHSARARIAPLPLVGAAVGNDPAHASFHGREALSIVDAAAASHGTARRAPHRVGHGADDAQLHSGAPPQGVEVARIVGPTASQRRRSTEARTSSNLVTGIAE